jgi:hypothetical protein
VKFQSRSSYQLKDRAKVIVYRVIVYSYSYSRSNNRVKVKNVCTHGKVLSQGILL